MTDFETSHHNTSRKKLPRRLFATALSLILLILLLVLVTYIILRPKKPRFILQDATIYAFNLTTATNSLTTTLQATISSHNPNSRISILYEQIHVYASYRRQQITLPALLPANTYQGHRDTIVWSPFLYGSSVPLATYHSGYLNKDQTAGTVLINIRVSGRIRWKVGAFVSWRYHLSVNCPAYINFGEKNNGIAVGPAVIKYQLIMSCGVHV
ncbi:NDR1/HIN1-like protein 1 [Primulina eburnea]|uniref:NDR1/HIN1-like protein 1 n=1 Tax=Primulina eburnea TaxID=1245227 RepID=UPI003C6C66BE